MLEPCAVKVARTVLRGGGGSNVSLLTRLLIRFPVKNCALATSESRFVATGQITFSMPFAVLVNAQFLTVKCISSEYTKF